MEELVENLGLVIDDCEMIKQALEEGHDDHWDLYDKDNWTGMVDILVEAKNRLAILEEQNTLLWTEKNYEGGD